MLTSDLSKLVGNRRKRQDLLKEFSLSGLSVDNVSATPGASDVAGASGGSVDGQVAQISQQLMAMQSAQNSQMNQLLASAGGLQSGSYGTAAGTTTGSAAGGILSSLFGGVLGGLSPVIQGLFSLFGGSSSQTVQPLVPFELPTAINYEGGVSQGSSGVVPVDYGQGNQARPLTSSGSSGQSNQNVQIQVNAMDSQSFMDHSDDIAAAVRQALLTSNSLSDVIADL